ncbi:hypothetical protein VNO80_35162 [Phaseolus coccineus]|uniref:Uncharacterized protein n=1 Tax=Phaseolus coccineus TaxID=3886 RepID=A0AAN9KTH7_PHACN
MFFSIPSDADTGSLDVSICPLANGEWGVDRLVVWGLANARVSEDPKVTHVVRPVLATMHGQGGTRGGTVLSDAVHAVNPGRSWSGDPCSSRQ